MGTLAGRSFELAVDPENWKSHSFGPQLGGGEATYADEMIWADMTDEQQAAVVRLVRSQFGEIKEELESTRTESYGQGRNDGYTEGRADGQESGFNEGQSELRSRIRKLLGD